MSLGALIVPFIVKFLVLFVALYVVTEYGHYYLYDQGPPMIWARVAVGALILGGLLVWKPLSFDTMFTSNIGMTILHGIAWFLVFIFVLRFHPWHAVGLGVATMLLVAGLADLAADSFRRSQGHNPIPVRQPSKAYRQTIPSSSGRPAAAKPAGAPAPAP